jgi:hypothetical protein
MARIRQIIADGRAKTAKNRNFIAADVLVGHAARHHGTIISKTKSH